MTDKTDFSNYPPSITEIKASRSGSGHDWTPTDVLINALREIQNGKINPDCLVVIFSTPDDSHIYMSGPDKRTIIGTIERGKALADEN